MTQVEHAKSNCEAKKSFVLIVGKCGELKRLCGAI